MTMVNYYVSQNLELLPINHTKQVNRVANYISYPIFTLKFILIINLTINKLTKTFKFDIIKRKKR